MEAKLLFKNAKEIRKAVDMGIAVYSDSTAYQVIKDRIGQYLIKCSLNGHCIGLTWDDNETLNGNCFFAEGE